MNYARLCGAAGRRTDILILPIAGPGAHAFVYGRPINRLAATGAGQFLLMATDRQDNLLIEDLDRLIIKGRPRAFLDVSLRRGIQEILSKFAGTREIIPSSGPEVLLYLLDTHPDHKITLFGFTHAGWYGHPWSAEAAWIDQLVEAAGYPERPSANLS